MKIKINELLKYCELDDYIILCDSSLRIIAQGTRAESFFMQERRTKRYTVDCTRRKVNGKDAIIAKRL